ncbi:MAG: FAD-dependent thymidylate synthase [Rhodospirillaceae bacterium]
MVYPLYIHAQVLTHRVFSRNTASARAIPVEKMISLLEASDRAEPVFWGRNCPGMSARGVELSEHEKVEAREIWLEAAKNAVASARALAKAGVHKQHANRILAPFSHTTVILSGTEWDNFFTLRADGDDAQPEVQELARKMRAARELSSPSWVEPGDWHNPFPGGSLLAAAGRCARVSYLTHDGRRDEKDDERLGKQLLEDGHMSPFEHIAYALEHKDHPTGGGNFRGWVQYRHYLPLLGGDEA